MVPSEMIGDTETVVSSAMVPSEMVDDIATVVALAMVSSVMVASLHFIRGHVLALCGDGGFVCGVCGGPCGVVVDGVLGLRLLLIVLGSMRANSSWRSSSHRIRNFAITDDVVTRSVQEGLACPSHL